MPDPNTQKATVPAAVLTAAEVQAARSAAAAAPPFTPAQRDRLTSIFTPAARRLTRSGSILN
jgi:hypothetical protein